VSQTFELPYYVQNNGDGSASVRFCPTLAQATREDEGQPDEWAEGTASTVKVKVEDGKLFFETIQLRGNKVERVWVEAPASK
jgi:hypothetical protein